jgi:hypothetical protein
LVKRRIDEGLQTRPDGQERQHMYWRMKRLSRGRKRMRKRTYEEHIDPSAAKIGSSAAGSSAFQALEVQDSSAAAASVGAEAEASSVEEGAIQASSVEVGATGAASVEVGATQASSEDDEGVGAT